MPQLQTGGMSLSMQRKHASSPKSKILIQNEVVIWKGFSTSYWSLKNTISQIIMPRNTSKSFILCIWISRASDLTYYYQVSSFSMKMHDHVLYRVLLLPVSSGQSLTHFTAQIYNHVTSILSDH